MEVMMATEKGKNLINSILSNMEGKPVEIRPEKVTKKRKSKESVIQSSSSNSAIPDSLEVINVNHAHFFDDQKETIRNYKNKRKPNLSDWLKVDFALYIKDLYFKRYQEDWGLKSPAVANLIAKVMDEIRNSLGYISNMILKDYIDYFFEQHIDNAIRENKTYYMSKLYNKNIITDFSESYNLHEAVKKEKIQKTDIITHEELEQSYSLGDENLVLNYGIVLSINWLIMSKKIEKQEVVNRIGRVCSKAHLLDKFNKIKDITEKYKYPKWFVYQNINYILSQVDEDLNINVVFTDEKIINQMFSFIKENNE